MFVFLIDERRPQISKFFVWSFPEGFVAGKELPAGALQQQMNRYLGKLKGFHSAKDESAGNGYF